MKIVFVPIVIYDSTFAIPQSKIQHELLSAGTLSKLQIAIAMA